MSNPLTTNNPYGIWSTTGEFINPPQTNLSPMVNSDDYLSSHINICLPMGNRPNASYCCAVNGEGSSQVDMTRGTCPEGYGRIRCDK